MVDYFKICTESEKKILTFSEGVSKAKNYGLKQARLEPKVVSVFESEPKYCALSIYLKHI